MGEVKSGICSLCAIGSAGQFPLRLRETAQNAGYRCGDLGWRPACRNVKSAHPTLSSYQTEGRKMDIEVVTAHSSRQNVVLAASTGAGEFARLLSECYP